MINKAIILSAGQGSRLLPLTATRPKCLIEVGGRTILDHQLDALFAADVDEVTVVTGYRSEMIDAHIAARGSKVSTLLNPQWETSSSIYSVWMARAMMSGNFVLMNGDTVYAPEIIAHAITRAFNGVNLLVDSLQQVNLDDMLVAADNDVIRAVGKTLPHDIATHRSLGVVIGRNENGRYRHMLETLVEAPDGKAQFHHNIIDQLAAQQTVHALPAIDGHWHEIDRPEDLEGWNG